MKTTFKALPTTQAKRLVLFTCAALVTASSLLVSCNKDLDKPATRTLNLPDEPLEYVKVDLPLLPEDQKHQYEATVSNEGATLGRVLFYDKALSVNGSVSCASCHDQQHAFCDPIAKSQGFDNELTHRNSPGFSNLMLYDSYFWDRRASTLEEMVLMPIQDHIEMGFDDLNDLVTRLNTLPYYEPLFRDAFGNSTVTSDAIASGLAQFLKSVWSSDSKYDQALRSGNWNTFTASENRGKALFEHEFICGSCHTPTNGNFGALFSANIGLDEHYSDNGLGALDEFGDNANGHFKIPSLRNVALTAPYMHDGRFATLRDVVNFYNENIQRHANLDFRFLDPSQGWDSPPNPGGNGGKIHMEMTEQDKEDLIAFLHTLTDERYTNDERFSNPFETIAEE